MWVIHRLLYTREGSVELSGCGQISDDAEKRMRPLQAQNIDMQRWYNPKWRNVRTNFNERRILRCEDRRL